MGLARDTRADGATDVAMPGLQNETGEYNCFLNVIIQCLWHCSDFRAGLMALPINMLQGAVSSDSNHVPRVLRRIFKMYFSGKPLRERIPIVHGHKHSCYRRMVML